MSFDIPAKGVLSFRFPSSGRKSSVTLCNNLTFKVSLQVNSFNKYNNIIRAFFDVNGDSVMLLVDPVLLSSCDAASFNVERTNLGDYFCVSYLRQRIRELGHKSCVTFYSTVPGLLVRLALMPTPGRVEISGNLKLQNLENGDQFHVPHSNIINYARTARDYKIRASIDVYRASKQAQLFLLSDLLCSCDAVCFSFEHHSKGTSFRATYFSGAVEVYSHGVLVEVYEREPDFYVMMPPRAYKQIIGMSMALIEHRHLLK